MPKEHSKSEAEPHALKINYLAFTISLLKDKTKLKGAAKMQFCHHIFIGKKLSTLQNKNIQLKDFWSFSLSKNNRNKTQEPVDSYPLV